MTKADLHSLRHPSELSRFWLTLVIVVPAVVIAIAVVFATTGLALIAVAYIAVVVWIAARIAMAHFLGGFVKCSEDNFSEIAASVDEFRTLFGYDGQVDAYVYEQGSFNALLVPLLRRKVILLNSDVVATAKSENEVRWIVARFIGSLASKHYRFSWLQVVLTSIESLVVFNLLLYPYERAVVKSGDQMGLYAVGGDLESAVRASYKFMAGGALGDAVNLAGILRQHDALAGTFFGWLAKCVSPFPHQTARIVNLLRFANARYPVQMHRFLAGADEETLKLVAGFIDEEPRMEPDGQAGRALGVSERPSVPAQRIDRRPPQSPADRADGDARPGAAPIRRPRSGGPD